MRNRLLINGLAVIIWSTFAGRAAGAGEWIAVRHARTTTTETREVRIRGSEGTLRWDLLARRREGTDDEARWSLAGGIGGGRLVVGSQRRLGLEPDRRGWTDPLAVRRAPPPPSPSSARTGVGVSWSAGGAFTRRFAAGRDVDGAPVAHAVLGVGGWLVGGGLSRGDGVAALGWGGRPGGVPVRAEAMVRPGGGLVRAGVGGEGEAGIVLEADALDPERPSRSVRAGAAVERGPLHGLWMEGAVRGGSSRARPFLVGWTGRSAAWIVRGEVDGDASGPGSSWRLTLERTGPEGSAGAVTLEGRTGPRPDGVRWRWRGGGDGTGLRLGVELPAGKPRSGSARLDLRAAGDARLQARVRWATGRRPALDLTCTLPLSTR